MTHSILTVNVDDAKISELLNATAEGQLVLITRQNIPIALLSPIAINQTVLEGTKVLKQKRRLGTATGLFTLSEDFDEPLQDFEEYQ